MTTIHDICDDAQTIVELLAEIETHQEETGETELTEEQRATLAGWLGETQAAFQDKVDAYVAVIRKFKNMELEANEESKRLGRRAKMHSRKVDSLKQSLQFAMDRLGLDKCKTALNTVTIATNGGRVPLEIDVEKLTADLCQIKVAPDLQKIHERLADGEPIAGVKVLERGKSLRIR